MLPRLVCEFLVVFRANSVKKSLGEERLGRFLSCMQFLVF